MLKKNNSRGSLSISPSLQERERETPFIQRHKSHQISSLHCHVYISSIYHHNIYLDSKYSSVSSTLGGCFITSMIYHKSVAVVSNFLILMLLCTITLYTLLLRWERWKFNAKWKSGRTMSEMGQRLEQGQTAVNLGNLPGSMCLPYYLHHYLSLHSVFCQKWKVPHRIKMWGFYRNGKHFTTTTTSQRGSRKSPATEYMQ